MNQELQNRSMNSIKAVQFCTSLTGHENDIRDISIVSNELFDNVECLYESLKEWTDKF